MLEVWYSIILEETAFVDIPSIIFAGAAFFAILEKIDLLYILILEEYFPFSS